MFEETKKAVAKYGLPAGDLYDMPSSDLRFPDGSHYRIECPTVNTAEAAKAILETAEKNGIVINRITETYGMFRHTREEIREYVKACADYGAELILSTGPRAVYDTGATVLSEQGVQELRGMSGRNLRPSGASTVQLGQCP